MYPNLHEHYDQLPARMRSVVDDGYEACCKAMLEGRRIDLMGDDRSEKLVDAIARFIIESNREKAAGWKEQADAERRLEELPLDQQEAHGEKLSVDHKITAKRIRDEQIAGLISYEARCSCGWVCSIKSRTAVEANNYGFDHVCEESLKLLQQGGQLSAIES